MNLTRLIPVVVVVATASCAHESPKGVEESHVDAIYRGSISQYGSRGLKEFSYERQGMVVNATTNWKPGLSKGFSDRPITQAESDADTSHTVSYATGNPPPIATAGVQSSARTTANAGDENNSTYTTNSQSFQPNRIEKGKCSYVVRKGDTLWNISGTKLGNNYQWRQIYKDNAITIGGNPDLIYPEQQYWIENCE